MRYERQGTMGYNVHKDPEHIAAADIEDVDEALVMALSAFDSEVCRVWSGFKYTERTSYAFNQLPIMEANSIN